MAKYFYVFVFALIMIGCSQEYKPNGNYPEEDDPIDYIFYDTISGMQANVKLEFMTDSCRSISATYGENQEIFYQIIMVNEDIYDIKQCMKETLLPLFEKYKRVKKNKNSFDFFVSNDTIDMAIWHEKNYIFFMIARSDYVEDAVYNSYFLEFK